MADQVGARPNERAGEQGAPWRVAAGAAGWERWLRPYTSGQTLAAFALALVATAAVSMDPTQASYGAIRELDPSATGALYICYEILLSFAGHADAVLLLALACLLVLPVRYVLFGRRERLRPSVMVPAAAFAACMVFGKSYDMTDSARLVLGGISSMIESAIAGAGWMVLGATGLTLLFELFDWFGVHRLPFTEGRYGRIWRLADVLLNRHPFAIPLLIVVVAWMPTFVASMPGLFMGDTGAQIRQWFNLPNGTSDYLNLINPQVLLNGHHPVAHTALLGTCVELGMQVFGSENAGLLIYTTVQFLVTAVTVAYLVASLRRFGVGLVPRAVVLLFFIGMPLFSNYAVLITKDVLFGDAFAALVVQTAVLLAALRPATAPQVAVEASGATGVRLIGMAGAMRMRRRDWAVLAAACVGCAFLRNGGVVFPLAAGVMVGGFGVVAAWRGRRAGARVSRVWIGAVAVVAVAVAANMAFTRVVMPALDITPGSRREVLSIPFQQTARYVLKHDGAAAGISDGTGSADGTVTDEQRAAIDAVLGYGTLASRYDPDKSDAVKNGYNEDATTEQLAAYLRVWAQMLVQDPGSYLSAVANNYYGYFYPSSRDVFTYDVVTSAETMTRPSNRAYFDFHPVDSGLVRACGHAVTLYRVAIQRIPLLSLLLSSSTYVWLLLAACVYLLGERQWRGLALMVPLLGVLAVCLIGPCNGSTYMRYLYPAILALPFAVPVALVWPRALWREQGGRAR